jgi:hypothetical protein
MYPRWQRGLATHKECMYFNSGLCVLNGVAVSPDKLACPNFKPKGAAMTPEPRRSRQRPRRLPRVSGLRRQHAFLLPSNPEVTFAPAQQLVPYCGGSVSQRGVYIMPSGRAVGRERQGRVSGRKIGELATDASRACICPSCGYTRPYRLGTPCFRQKCSYCRAPMTRKRWYRDEHVRRITNWSY